MTQVASLMGGVWAGGRTRVWVESVAATLTAVAVLVLLGKGIGALGQALALPNACWQLLALRAAAVVLVAGTLVRTGRDLWWLFGVGYAAALMMSHTSMPLFLATVGAGLAAWGVRVWVKNGWGVVAVPLVFMTVLAGASLYRKVGAQGWVAGGGEWLFDLGIRMSGGVAALVLVASVWGWVQRWWGGTKK